MMRLNGQRTADSGQMTADNGQRAIKTVLRPLSVVLFLAITAHGETALEGEVSEAFAGMVKTVKAAAGRPVKELIASGAVTCDPDKSVTYVPLVNGTVVRAAFTLGAKVEKGQPMLDIRTPEVVALQAEMAAVEVELKAAKRGLRWAEEMFEDKMISEMERIEAQEKVDQAEASKERIQAALELFGEVKGRGVFSVLAPMGGYVIEKQVTEGMTVAEGGDPLFTIADLGTVWVVANVYASNIPFVKDGMEADISCISYPGQVFTGKVAAVSQVFDPEDKALKARIVVENADLKFKPGMSVEIRFKQPADKPLVAVPSDALVFDNNCYYVVVRKGAKQFAVKEVKTFNLNQGLAYLASGLNEGEEVVTKNQILIYSELKGI